MKHFRIHDISKILDSLSQLIDEPLSRLLIAINWSFHFWLIFRILSFEIFELLLSETGKSVVVPANDGCRPWATKKYSDLPKLCSFSQKPDSNMLFLVFINYINNTVALHNIVKIVRILVPLLDNHFFWTWEPCPQLRDQCREENLRLGGWTVFLDVLRPNDI